MWLATLKGWGKLLSNIYNDGYLLIHIVEPVRFCFCFQDILNRLLNGNPSYTNFYERWSQPMSCYEVQSIVNYKSSQEKEEMFTHFKENVAR